MLAKIFKWLSSDRSEDYTQAPPRPEPTLGTAQLAAMRQALEGEKIWLDDKDLRELGRLLAKHQKIDAIKWIREKSQPRIGLKEAKEASELLEQVLAAGRPNSSSR